MLSIIVTGTELFDEETQTFSTVGDQVLELEHSLVSLSKWESKFQKPFLSDDGKSGDELIWYVRFMMLSDFVDPTKEIQLSQENLDTINSYIDSPQSATTFGLMPETKGRGETITSELIYYWLVAFNIPFEVETWHLNRLFSLIKICNIKNSKPTKMSRRAIAERNRQLNAERREKYGTTG
jgi:hypothetical protein